MSLQEQKPKEEIQPFGITLIAALTAIIPLVILLRGSAYTTSILAALLGVTAGVGLFLQKAWGRWLTIAYYVAGIGLAVLQGQGSPVVFLIVILPIAIIAYLFLPGVVRQFPSKNQR
jgi:hypothetical protein